MQTFDLHLNVQYDYSDFFSLQKLINLSNICISFILFYFLKYVDYFLHLLTNPKLYEHIEGPKSRTILSMSQHIVKLCKTTSVRKKFTVQQLIQSFTSPCVVS